MKQVFIDEVFYNEIQTVAKAKGITPAAVIAMALVNELGNKSNQAILKPERERRKQAK